MKKAYEITEKAGRFVAGSRRPADGILLLTEGQAEHELRLGNIRPVAPAPVVDEPMAEDPQAEPAPKKGK